MNVLRTNISPLSHPPMVDPSQKVRRSMMPLQSHDNTPKPSTSQLSAFQEKEGVARSRNCYRCTNMDNDPIEISWDDLNYYHGRTISNVATLLKISIPTFEHALLAITGTKSWRAFSEMPKKTRPDQIYQCYDKDGNAIELTASDLTELKSKKLSDLSKDCNVTPQIFKEACAVLLNTSWRYLQRRNYEESIPFVVLAKQTSLIKSKKRPRAAQGETAMASGMKKGDSSTDDLPRLNGKFDSDKGQDFRLAEPDLTHFINQLDEPSELFDLDTDSHPIQRSSGTDHLPRDPNTSSQFSHLRHPISVDTPQLHPQIQSIPTAQDPTVVEVFGGIELIDPWGNSRPDGGIG